MTADAEREAYKAKLRSLNFGTHGRTRDRVVDGRRPDGERCKSTTDELGNTVTESAERQDVHIRAPHVVLKAGTVEERRRHE